MVSLKSIFVLLMNIQISTAAINASLENFYISCGTRASGPMDIMFNNSNAQLVSSVYVNNKPVECSLKSNGTIYTLENLRKRGCAIKDPTAPYPAFHAVVFLQEDPMIQRITDPKFLLSCGYTSGEVKVSTSALSVRDTTWNIKDYHWEMVHGYVDMFYQLGIYEDDGIFNTPIVTANFGQKMALKITMSGTDEDEQGIRVRECTATSGGREAKFIDNFCSSSSLLGRNIGFISNGTQTILTGLEAFRIAGSEELTVTFECLLDVCPAVCDGLNCRPSVRKRRDTTQIGNGTQIQASWRISIVDREKPESDRYNKQCLNRMEFYVPMASLGALLCGTILILLCVVLNNGRKTGFTKASESNTEIKY